MPRSLVRTFAAPARPNLLRRLSDALAIALERRRDRILLARLDERLLRDIGVTPDMARIECAKPFWRA